MGAALFVSDEKTEVFLRDQRRSQDRRAIGPRVDEADRCTSDAPH
jgi:hypothetical protein